MPNLRNGSKGGFEPGLPWLWVRHSTAELPRSIKKTQGQGHEHLCVTPACLYGTETLALTELQQQRLQVCENNWIQKIARVKRADKMRMDPCISSTLPHQLPHGFTVYLQHLPIFNSNSIYFHRMIVVRPTILFGCVLFVRTMHTTWLMLKCDMFFSVIIIVLPYSCFFLTITKSCFSASVLPVCDPYTWIMTTHTSRILIITPFHLSTLTDTTMPSPLYMASLMDTAAIGVLALCEGNIPTRSLDFAKAFDTVPQQRLLAKLRGYDIGCRILTWMEAFLMDRRLRVSSDSIVNDSRSALADITSWTTSHPQFSHPWSAWPIYSIIPRQPVIAEALLSARRSLCSSVQMKHGRRSWDECPTTSNDIDTRATRQKLLYEDRLRAALHYRAYYRRSRRDMVEIHTQHSTKPNKIH